MIAGLLLRNFKTYKGINFIPFLIRDLEFLEIFIGDNGTGKSSVLEALNCYFNNGKWIQTTGQKESYVAPLFLLEKEKYKNRFTDKTHALVESLNNYFWNLPGESGSKYSQTQQSLINYIHSLKSEFENTHYLLLLGNFHVDRHNLFFATFDKEVKNKVLGYEWDEGANELRKKSDQTTINKLMLELDELLTFIYIPAEADIPHFLKLESKGMQELVNREIKDDIEAILKQPYTEGGSKESILDYINKKLMPYIEDVEKTIQKIDETYKFKGDNRSTKLNSRDLIGPIIRVFYAKRRLEKNNKPIDDLSSGERKKALVDIVYSFLSQMADTEKEIIFAIDEPESSLDTENRYDSFERVEKIANEYQHQTFITTHWYGLLPIIHKGIIHCLQLGGEEEIKPVVKTYDARTFIAERKKEKDDNYFKSFSDLASSIFRSMRDRKINWIIVEGVSDKNYLEYYIKNIAESYTDHFRIIPLGGSGNVKLLYEHLYIPIAHSEVDKLMGLVLCIIDTDEGLIKTGFDSKTANKKLLFKRLQNVKGEIKLLHAKETGYSQKTDIEDSLEPQKFYTAIKAVIEKDADETTKQAFQNFRYNEEAQTSAVEGDESILIPIAKEGVNPISDKKIVVEFINGLENKDKISVVYCSQPFDHAKIPKWITDSFLTIFYSKESIVESLKTFTPEIVPEIQGKEDILEELKND